MIPIESSFTHSGIGSRLTKKVMSKNFKKEMDFPPVWHPHLTLHTETATLDQ